jgi:hypothetical protein
MMVTERETKMIRHLCVFTEELPEMPPELKKIEQPGAQDPGMNHYKRFHAGSERSQKRLEELNYDPIGELVAQYHDIQRLINEELNWKAGREVRFNAKGQARVFHHDFLDKLLDKKERIADKLLRYGYGRVPEIGITEEKPIPAFSVISTRGESIRRLQAPKVIDNE